MISVSLSEASWIQRYRRSKMENGIDDERVVHDSSSLVFFTPSFLQPFQIYQFFTQNFTNFYYYR